MTGSPAIVLLRLVFEDHDLLAAILIGNRGRHTGALDHRGTDRHIAGATQKEDTVEGNLGSRFAVELLDAQDITDLDAILLSTGFDNGVLRIAAGR